MHAGSPGRDNVCIIPNVFQFFNKKSPRTEHPSIYNVCVYIYNTPCSGQGYAGSLAYALEIRTTRILFFSELEGCMLVLLLQLRAVECCVSV